MVVGDFNIKYAFFPPYETQTPLLVDANAVLALPVAFQRLQVIAGRAFQKVQGYSCIQLRQLAGGNFHKTGPAPGFAGFEKRLCILAAKAFYYVDLSYIGIRYFSIG